MENFKNSKFFLFIRKLLSYIDKFDLSQKSAALTYYFLLCVGPFMMLFLFLALSFLQTNPDFIVNTLSQFVQEPELIVEPIMDYLKNMRSGSIAIISILVTLYSASRASKNLIDSIDSIFEIEEKDGIRATIFDIIFAIFFTAIFLLSLLLFLATFVYGDPITVLINFLFNIDLRQFGFWSFLITYLPIIYLFFMSLIIFKVISIRKDYFRLSKKEIILGSSFTTIGWILSSAIYSLYINNFNSRNVIYGTLGNFMILMLWFYLLIFILLLGTLIIKLCRDMKNL